MTTNNTTTSSVAEEREKKKKNKRINKLQWAFAIWIIVGALSAIFGVEIFIVGIKKAVEIDDKIENEEKVFVDILYAISLFLETLLFLFFVILSIGRSIGIYKEMDKLKREAGVKFDKEQRKIEKENKKIAKEEQKRKKQQEKDAKQQEKEDLEKEKELSQEEKKNPQTKEPGNDQANEKDKEDILE